MVYSSRRSAPRTIRRQPLSPFTVRAEARTARLKARGKLPRQFRYQRLIVLGGYTSNDNPFTVRAEARTPTLVPVSASSSSRDVRLAPRGAARPARLGAGFSRTVRMTTVAFLYRSNGVRTFRYSFYCSNALRIFYCSKSIRRRRNDENYLRNF